MKSFGEEKELTEEMIESISTFLSFVYIGKKMSLPDARWFLFTQLKEEEQLPPIKSAITQHLLRALFQTFEWKSASKMIIEKLDPVYFGWYQECDSYYPVSMTSDAIPSSLKVFIRCKCGGRCDSRRCHCRRSDPPNSVHRTL